MVNRNFWIFTNLDIGCSNGYEGLNQAFARKQNIIFGEKDTHEHGKSITSYGTQHSIERMAG